MTAKDILERYIKFFEKRGHARIENSSLVPLNDPTTLFTSSGMQPLVPFLLGETHPQGVRLVNAQNCFRAQDIDEIGDNRHTTFFRMLGNWSLGDYFKKEQIPWFFEFLINPTEGIGLDPSKLYVTVFAGDSTIEKDTESAEIWKNLFESKRISTEDRILEYGVEKNWWSRSGTPDRMPVGEPGGPDTEVFFDFETEHNPEFGEKCHVNCDCGRYMEIGNSVFMQYLKTISGFQNLPKQNVDFGGGLERLVAASENKQDVFETTLFAPIVRTIEQITGKDYVENKRAMRIITDHIIASVFIIANGVFPSNKEQGYVLRRLLRRTIRYARQLGLKDNVTSSIAEKVIETYISTDSYLSDHKENILDSLNDEESKFSRVLTEGLKKIETITKTLEPLNKDVYSSLMQIPNKNELFRSIYKGEDVDLSKFNFPSGNIQLTKTAISNATISGIQAFDLQQSYGFPVDMVVELAQEKRLLVDVEEARNQIKAHQDLSRSGASQKFAGGLADHTELTVKGHTATHLLHQALRDVLGDSVFQTGSNITPKRVRFDFSYDKKVTNEELAKAKEIVQEKIKEDLMVHFEIMPLKKARALGAIGLFNDKYAEDVKIYFIGVGPASSAGRPRSDYYSVEFCGGPHIEHTALIKSFDILKEEGVSRGVRRVYAKVS